MYKVEPKILPVLVNIGNLVVTFCTTTNLSGYFSHPCKKAIPKKKLLIFWVLVDDGWLDKIWTQGPVFVQSLSKTCLLSVQSRGMYRVCPVAVKVPSNLKAGKRVHTFVLDLKVFKIPGFLKGCSCEGKQVLYWPWVGREGRRQAVGSRQKVGCLSRSSIEL